MSLRTEKITSTIHQILAQELSYDEQARKNIISIVYLSVSNDLRNSTLHISAFYPLDEKIIESYINHLTKVLQSALSTKLRARRTPRLKIVLV